jgi:hypothetical protein
VGAARIDGLNVPHSEHEREGGEDGNRRASGDVRQQETGDEWAERRDQ